MSRHTGSKTQQVGSPPEWSREHVAAPRNKRNGNSLGWAQAGDKIFKEKDLNSLSILRKKMFWTRLKKKEN